MIRYQQSKADNFAAIQEKKRKFQINFYENGITFKTHNGTETMPIRTSLFPILNLYWWNNDEYLLTIRISKKYIILFEN